ncbi:MAG: hypothetical protein ACI9EF_002277 [Pseudohongiellaceae bacterium]|jgi:hypothetical protein
MCRTVLTHCEDAMAEADNTNVHDHALHSVGGQRGHLARRVFHVSMAAIPVLWYWHVGSLEEALGQSRQTLLGWTLSILVVLEFLRISRGITVFGQRNYEARQFSAMGWGSVSVGATLYFAPALGVQGAAMGLPIIWSLAIVDPLLGELRRAGKPNGFVFAAGVATTAAIWVCSGLWLGAPLWLAAIMAPLTVAAEWPRIRWIDDNATMTLVPLVAALALAPLI